MVDENKHVLVTGASTGIGRVCVEYLGRMGFHVYAGVISENDIEAINNLENVVGIKLDVTRDKDVQSLVEMIEAKGTGLFGLVNNAGIAIGGPLMDITVGELQQQFDVNLLGVHRVTRAVFPFILQSKGRIVMISSTNGRFAIPFIGPYVMSKFGLEGYSDVLRREMIAFGINVILVEPGAIKTQIWEKGLEQAEAYKHREHAIDLLSKIAMQVVPENLENYIKNGKEPIEVAKVVFRALTASEPKLRYPVVKKAWIFKLSQMISPKFIDKIILKKFNKIIVKINK